MFSQPSSLIWRTPGIAVERENVPERSPLARYPVVLSPILKLLSFWDVQALIGAGCPELSALVRRHCTKAHFFRVTGVSGAVNEPEMMRNPFPLLAPFKALNSLHLHLNACKPSNSPWSDLPSTMRHITIRVLQPSIDAFDFLTVPYAQHFPALETLRLSARAFTHEASTRTFPLDYIPRGIKTLSIILAEAFAEEQAFSICHPLGFGINDIMPSDESGQKLQGPNYNGGRFIRQIDFNNSEIYQHALKSIDPSTRNTWKYMFDAIEFFEWGKPFPGARSLSVSPLPVLMPPTLRHYIQNSSYGALVQVPSRRVTNNHGSNSSGLLTVYNESQWDQAWIDMLPKSITKLHLRKNTGLDRIDFSGPFPALRSFSTTSALDTNTVRFPDSTMSLSFSAFSASTANRYTHFSDIAPPFSLTHLCIEAPPVMGVFACLPATLISLDLVSPMTSSFFRSQVVPFLPPNLRRLRLKVRDFSPEQLSLFPRGLLELTICAESLLLAEWVHGEVWDENPRILDLSQLPPQLRHLAIYTMPLKVILPSAMLAELPRTLESLALSEVQLSTADPELPSEGLATSSSSSISTATPSSSSTSAFGFFQSAISSIGKMFSRKPKVAPSVIQEALDFLPPNCWCHIFFQDETLKRKDIESSVPTEVCKAVQRMLPSPMTTHSLMSPSAYTTEGFVRK